MLTTMSGNSTLSTNSAFRVFHSLQAGHMLNQLCVYGSPSRHPLGVRPRRNAGRSCSPAPLVAQPPPPRRAQRAKAYHSKGIPTCPKSRLPDQWKQRMSLPPKPPRAASLALAQALKPPSAEAPPPAKSMDASFTARLGLRAARPFATAMAPHSTPRSGDGAARPPSAISASSTTRALAASAGSVRMAAATLIRPIPRARRMA